MTQQQPAIVCLQETFLKANDDITIKKTHQSYNFINNTGRLVSQSLLGTTYLKAKSTSTLNSKQ